MADSHLINILLWMLSVGVVVNGDVTEVSDEVAISANVTKPLSITTLTMAIAQIWVSAETTTGSCKTLGTTNTDHHLYFKSATCSVNLLISSGDVNLVGGSVRQTNMADIKCYQPVSDWNIVYVNHHASCNSKFTVRVTWGCTTSGALTADGCKLNMKTEIPSAPIWVGDQITTSVELSDDPLLLRYPKVVITTNFAHSSSPSLPETLKTSGKHEFILTITSSGVHTICLNTTTDQYIETGTTCETVTVNDVTALPTASPTAAPTAVPPTTLTPTAVPTAAPNTSVTAVPTTAPTASPTTSPVSLGSTSLPTTTTDVPPSTAVPTDIPPTAVPTPIPSTGTPVIVSFGTGTVGGGASLGASVGSMLAGSTSGGSLSKTMVIVNQMKCSDGLPTEKLPFIVHPLMFSIQGNYWAGAVIGNVALCLLSYVIFTVLCFVAKRQRPNKNVDVMMRYPGIMIPASLILYPSILQYSGGLILHVDSLTMKIIGVAGAAFCLALFTTVLFIFRTNHKKCNYLHVSPESESHSPVVIYAFGRGAWEDAVSGSQYIGKFGTVFDCFRHIKWLKGYYILIEFGQVPFLVAAAWIRTNSLLLCTVRISILFVVTFVQWMVIFKYNVFIAKMLTHLHIATGFVILTALVMELISIHAYDDENNPFDSLSTSLMTVSVSLVLLRAAYDVLVFVVDVVSGYKNSIIEEAHNEEDAGGMMKPTFSDLSNPLMMFEASTDFQNMEYNLLHWESSEPTRHSLDDLPPWRSCEVSL
eukprot:TRINITY_DN414_c0_g1_i4.p1 TRINITY_DN414_c0_g1~~TRINITY_DN414_c0_g1_i4.p1  ORF type:complete len:758 (+),score=148.96 TRINITY_DN414_c0_g1_i4:47-2320(+)